MHSLRIRHVTLVPYQCQLGLPVQSAGNSLSVRQGLLLKLKDDCGFEGVGEASPLPGYSSESYAEVYAQAQGVLANSLKEVDLSMSGLTLLRELLSSKKDLFPSLRCALETACLDLIAQRTRQSVASLLGVEHGRVPISVLVSSNPALRAEEVQSALALGVQTIKYKLGSLPIEHELETLHTLRKWVGKDVRIRIDANRKFSVQEAVRVASLLEPIEPEFVEEITYEPHRMVPVGIQLALDESLVNIDPFAEMPAFWKHEVFQVVVLKPSLLGGIQVCHRFAEQARKYNKQMVVTHMFEGPIGAAVCAELALMLSVFGGVLACSLDPDFGAQGERVFYPGYAFRRPWMMDHAARGCELVVNPSVRWQTLVCGG